MKAIQITEPSVMKIIDIAEPQMGDDEVLLKMKYVGFCGSDLNTFRGGNPMVKMPVVPGHEVGAEIVKVGKNVPDVLKPGMTVTVNPYTTLGVQRWGAMCEYLSLPWAKVIPAGQLSARTSALIEPMSVGFHAVSRAQVTDIDVVMVIGCGMVGMGAVVRAAQRGAIVIAADIDDEKLALAKQMGASYAVNTKTEDVHARLMEITSGFGPDVIIEAVGSIPTYQMAINEVAFTGRVVCIGYAKSEVSFQTKYFVQKELDIRGSRNAQPSDFRAVIRYLERGTCPVDRLISNEVKPEGAANAMDQWAANPGKVFRILVNFR